MLNNNTYFYFFSKRFFRAKKTPSHQQRCFRFVYFSAFRAEYSVYAEARVTCVRKARQDIPHKFSLCRGYRDSYEEEGFYLLHKRPLLFLP